MQTAAVYAPNPRLYNKAVRSLNTDEVAEPNAFAVEAAVAAFSEGGEWLDELREYIFANKQYTAKFLAEKLPELFLVRSEATYLLWIDCSKVSPNASELASFIRKETGLYVSSGEQYGECGKAFIRLNIACPRSTLTDGLNRLYEGVKKFR